MLIRRFFAFVISAFLIFYPAYSYATTSVGGWTAIDTITTGATNTINATKTAGGKALKSSITVAASTVKVGKHLIKGGGSAALAFAMVELADGAIDWILDPANNAVKYKDPTAVGGGDDGSVAGTVYRANLRTDQTDWHSSKTAACLYTMSLLIAVSPDDNWQFVGITGSNCNYSRVSGSYQLPLYSKQGVPEGAGVGSGDGYKYIPIETVAAKVIANAEAGHAPSQEAVKATALEGFAAGEHDAALDAAATETGTQNPPDTENPPKDGEAVPFDPSSIIAAINSLKAMLAGILSSMTGFFDWFQAPFTPPAQEKEEVGFATTDDVGLDSVDRFEQRIEFSGQCPSNEFSFSMMGVTYAKPIPYHHLCGFLEQIAPWLLAMCYLGTAYFIVENI